jgi:hypothetical protein
MNRSKNYLSRGVALMSFSLAIIFAVVSAGAQPQAPFSFNLVPASDAIGICLPNASAEVTIFPKEETAGKDTFDLKAQGLKSNTAFAVFLTELPVAPFGAVQYIGDFTTNEAGRASLRVDTIVNEAFLESASKWPACKERT